jgi:Uma2 family endonuclease
MPAATLDPPPAEHLVLRDAPWSYYQDTLKQLADRRIQVSYLNGEMEIMSPLPEHEAISKAIGQLIEALTEELKLKRKSFGSTTFGIPATQAGLEPDQCYYLANAPAVVGMKRFDPAIHPVPDLAVEVDITRRAVPRLPIYAALGVPELWRYERGTLHVLLLRSGAYEPSVSSPTFPSISSQDLSQWIAKLSSAEDEVTTILEFRAFCRTLKR